MAATKQLRVPLLTEYALGWCLHQLAPFLDRTLAAAGMRVLSPMDHRMIEQPYDWYLRLPLALLALAMPTRNVLVIAHVVNIICWFERMPGVWDYMCWCALLELTFVLAALNSSTSAEVARKFLPAVRAELVVLYFSAAFWKLTTSWFDPHYSCSTVLMSELIAGIEPMLPFVRHLASLLLDAAPALVAGMEFAVPTLLLLRPRYGVLLALVFHQTINLMPTTYAGGFSISMCCRLLVFLPGFTNAMSESTRPLASAGLVGIATALMFGIHGGLDSHGAIFLALALSYFLATSAPPPSETTESLPPPTPNALPKMAIIVALCTYGSYASCALAVALLVAFSPLSLSDFLATRARGLAGAAAAIGFGYGFLLPVAGVMMMASSTMYGNVKNYGGGNHLIVPTGLLQDLYAESSPASISPAFLEGFGGGLVRVERTSSPSLLKLAVHGADVTEKLPARSRALLQQVNASGRYFEFYAARNYFDRAGDLQACALNAIEGSGKASDDPPYVVPAYELRRALSLARHAGEAFSLRYTRLPASLRTPTAWKAYVGESVVLDEPGGGGEASCTLVAPQSVWPLGRSACADDELVNLPPPMWWLTKLLHPYPIPLLHGSGDGVHCTT